MNITNFNQRLNETLSWCLSQEIVSNPDEDESVRHRRTMNHRGAELMSKVYKMLAPYEHASWISRWLARKEIHQAAEIRREGEQLIAAANAGSIVPPLRNQLRSPALRPFAQSLDKPGADLVAIVDQVAEARSRSLRQSAWNSDLQRCDLCGGRLLVYAPQENLADGAAEYVSLGFFDVDNVPPWDTWIVMLGKHLVCWVPPQLIPLAQEGLDVNPEQCILWADDPSLSREPIADLLVKLTQKVA